LLLYFGFTALYNIPYAVFLKLWLYFSRAKNCLVPLWEERSAVVPALDPPSAGVTVGDKCSADGPTDDGEIRRGAGERREESRLTTRQNELLFLPGAGEDLLRSTPDRPGPLSLARSLQELTSHHVTVDYNDVTAPCTNTTSHHVIFIHAQCSDVTVIYGHDTIFTLPGNTQARGSNTSNSEGEEGRGVGSGGQRSPKGAGHWKNFVGLTFKYAVYHIKPTYNRLVFSPTSINKNFIRRPIRGQTFDWPLTANMA